MIPPSMPLPTIDLYPANTLEGLIARELTSMILECEDHTINTEPIRDAIATFRELMREQKWPETYQHKYLAVLRDDLTTLTYGHPVTRQFVQQLNLELECN